MVPFSFRDFENDIHGDGYEWDIVQGKGDVFVFFYLRYIIKVEIYWELLLTLLYLSLSVLTLCAAISKVL